MNTDLLKRGLAFAPEGGATGAPAPQPSQVEVPAPPIQAPTTPTPPVSDSVPVGMKQMTDGNVQVLSPGAYKRLKDEARDKGRKQAMDELEKIAKEAGFGSLKEALGAIKKGGAQAANKPSQQPRRDAAPAAEPTEDRPAPGGNGNTRRELRERHQYQQQLARERGARLKAERQTRLTRRDLDAKDAEMELQRSAFEVGIKDTDYAIRLLTRHVANLSDDDRQKFDDRKFFEELRESRPYLFGEVTRPATTGTGAGGAPPSPKPGQVASTAAAGEQVDAKKMSGPEFQEMLRKRGLNLTM